LRARTRLARLETLFAGEVDANCVEGSPQSTEASIYFKKNMMLVDFFPQIVD